jgi:uncharacterized BrkB/YihY/UPF0761 family membrane protein
VVAIYGLYADPAAISRNLDSLSGLLPGGAIDVIRDQMTRIASHGKSTLGLASVIGLLVSLWSANAGIKSRDDVRYIYSTFPIIERAETEAHGRYLSRDLCLAWTAHQTRRQGCSPGVVTYHS